MSCSNSGCKERFLRAFSITICSESLLWRPRRTCVGIQLQHAHDSVWLLECMQVTGTAGTWTSKVAVWRNWCKSIVPSKDALNTSSIEFCHICVRMYLCTLWVCLFALLRLTQEFSMEVYVPVHKTQRMLRQMSWLNIISLQLWFHQETGMGSNGPEWTCKVAWGPYCCLAGHGPSADVQICTSQNASLKSSGKER